jgi:hypothetical protein
MRRSEFSLLLTILMLIGFGAAGLYLGFFANSTVCDPTCRQHVAGTVEPLPAFVGALFFLIGLYLMFRTLRRRQPSTLTAAANDGEVGMGEQARLAQQMRAFYTNPAHPLCKLANPTEFDRMMLSLFDSIQADATDIDTRIDGLRSYLQQKGFFRAYGDRFKVRLVWNKGAASLQWTRPSADVWQLRCNWNRLLRVTNVGPGWNDGQTVAPRWIKLPSLNARVASGE